MAGNTLGRLNEILFAELERLNEIDVNDAAALEAEVERSRAVQGVAREVNTVARSMLDTIKVGTQLNGSKVTKLPLLLES